MVLRRAGHGPDAVAPALWIGVLRTPRAQSATLGAGRGQQPGLKHAGEAEDGVASARAACSPARPSRRPRVARVAISLAHVMQRSQARPARETIQHCSGSVPTSWSSPTAAPSPVPALAMAAHVAPSASSISFPHVSAKALSELLQSELACPISAEQISSPNRAVAETCFSAFLEGLSGVNQELIDQRRDTAVEDLDHQELYISSFNILYMFHELRRLMDAATIKDFTLLDLTRPQKGRFKRHLSALHNFWGHRHDRIHEFDALTSNSMALVEERDELRREVAQKEDEIAKIKAQEKAEEQELGEISRRNDKLDKRLRELRAEQNRGLTTLDELQREKAAREQARVRDEERAHNLATDVEALRRRTRQSPEALIAALAQLNEALRAAKIELAEEERTAENAARQRDSAAALASALGSANEAMRRVVSEQSRADKEKAAASELEAQVAATETELDDLLFQHKQAAQRIEVDTARSERLLANLEQKRALWQRKREELQQSLKLATEDKQAKLQEAQARDKACRELENQVRHLQTASPASILTDRSASQIEEIHLKHHAQVLKLQEEHDALTRLAESYMNSIAQSLGIAF